MRRFLLSVATYVAISMAAGVATAQEAERPGGDEGIRVIDHFLVKGGPITWFILIPMSITTVALIIEYCVSIRRQTFVPQETFKQISEYLAERKYAEAVTYTAKEPSVLAGVVNTGLMESHNGYAAMERAVEEAIEERSARLLRKIEYLNVIGNISPMVGLFGTVYGMIRMFASIRQSGGIPEPARIGDDLSVALVATFWGLMIAIPSLGVFALFRNRIDVFTVECAIAADRLLTPFKPGVASGGAAERA